MTTIDMHAAAALMKKSAAPRRKPKPIGFALETDLCAHFLGCLDTAKWIAYPETGGWDILLVRRSDGFQIGIQAKLKLNLKVFDQSLEPGGGFYAMRSGPDSRAILVPTGQHIGEKIAEHVGVTIIMADPKGRYSPDLPGDTRWAAEKWHELCPSQRIKLPDFVPDVAAGASSPLKLSEWKVKALRVAVTAKARGFVTREDFRAYQIDVRRWLTMGWVERGEGGEMVLTAGCPKFWKQHPKVWQEMWDTREKWMRTHVPLLSGQRKLL